MPNIKIHEPREMKEAFEKSGLTLEQWCAITKNAKGAYLSYTYTSKLFARLDREHEERQIQRAKRILADSAPDAADKLVEHLQADDKALSHKAAVDLLERVGVSKHQPQVNIQNDNRTLVIAPLFKENYTEDVKRFLDIDDAD